MFLYAEQYRNKQLSPWRDKSFQSFLDYLYDDQLIDSEVIFESIYDHAQYYYLIEFLCLLEDDITPEQRKRAYKKTMVQDCDAGLVTGNDIGKHNCLADTLELFPAPDYIQETKAYKYETV